MMVFGNNFHRQYEFPRPNPIQKKPNPLKVSPNWGEKQHRWVPNCQATVSVVSVDLRKFAVVGKAIDSCCFSKQNPQRLGATPVSGKLDHLRHIHASPVPSCFIIASWFWWSACFRGMIPSSKRNGSIIWSPSSWSPKKVRKSIIYPFLSIWLLLLWS